VEDQPAWFRFPPSRLMLQLMLILVRHGQTSSNAAGLILGRADPPLSERGWRQAEALAAGLPSPARLISSPLLRARQTAAAFHLPVEVDERWIEMDYGDMDGTPVADVTAEIWERWHLDATFVPAGGESLASVGHRVREACLELLEQARVADVIIITHVSPIKAAITWALGIGDEVAWRMFVEDASIARIAFGFDGPLLMGFNQMPPLQLEWPA